MGLNVEKRLSVAAAQTKVADIYMKARAFLSVPGSLTP